MKKQLPASRQRPPRTWLITAVLAALALAYVWFLFLPGQRAIAELRAQVHERRQQIMQAQNLLATVAQTRARLEATREVGRQWRAEAPRRAEVITHFASLTQQAAAAGVAIERFDPLPPNELNVIAQQNVTLQFCASFAALFDLLRRLEELPGTIWVRNLRLQTGSDHEPQLRGELTLTIFVDRTD